MPEGDILRRTAAELDRALAGKVLLRAELRWPTVGGVDLVGRTVLGTAPYGKHLLTRFDDGWTLHTHLRMDGAWYVRRGDDPAVPVRDPKVRAVLATDGRLAVGRLLGMLDLVRTHDERSVIGHLGPDLLADEFEAAGVEEALTRYAARGATPVAEVLPADQVRAPRRLLLTARAHGRGGAGGHAAATRPHARTPAVRALWHARPARSGARVAVPATRVLVPPVPGGTGGLTRLSRRVRAPRGPSPRS